MRRGTTGWRLAAALRGAVLLGVVLLGAACGSPPQRTASEPTSTGAAEVTAPIHLAPPAPSTLALTSDTSCVLDDGRVVCWGGGRPPHVDSDLAGSATLNAHGDTLCALDLAGATLRCSGDSTFDAFFGGPSVETVSDAVAIELGERPLVRTSDGHFARPGSTTPPDVPPHTISVRSGHGTTCALAEDGTLTCTTLDRPPLVVDRVVDFAFERTSLCVLHQDTLECAPVSTWRAHDATERFSGTAGASRLAAGDAHVCVLAADGGVLCAGANERGQLGRGSHGPEAGALARVEGVRGATELAAGRHHTCARTAEGVRCWGDDGSGQVSGELVHYATASLTGATTLAAGWGHTCAVDGTGRLSCWGEGEAGQLGGAAAGDRMLPTRADLPGIDGITEVTAGAESTCVLFGGGRLACFGGSGRFRQETPDLGAVVDAVHIGGRGRSVQIVRAGGDVASYGAATGQRLDEGRREAGPAHVPTEVVQVVGDGSFVCALGDDGRVWSWGGDFGGELGDGGDGVRDEPTLVIAPIAMPATLPAREHLYETCDRACGTMTGVRALASFGRSTCAVLATGRVSCWGEDGHGRFAEGVDFARRPVLLDDVEHARTACLGADFLCVARDDGTVRCRGGGTAGEARNEELAALDHVTAIACGGEHACALQGDGTVRCWGESSGGRLGSDALLRGRAVAVAMP